MSKPITEHLKQTRYLHADLCRLADTYPDGTFERRKVLAAAESLRVAVGLLDRAAHAEAKPLIELVS